MEHCTTCNGNIIEDADGDKTCFQCGRAPAHEMPLIEFPRERGRHTPYKEVRGGSNFGGAHR
jgi:hypothetical protein